MERWKRTGAVVGAGAAVALTGWALLVTWASSAGVYENAGHTAGARELWLTLTGLLLALVGLALASTGRLRAAVPATLVALVAYVIVASLGAYTGYV